MGKKDKQKAAAQALTALDTSSRTIDSFPFLALPAELRNAVYEYIAADIQDTIRIQMVRPIIRRRQLPEDTLIQSLNGCHDMAILLACRQIHNEASSMLYGAIRLDMTKMSFLNEKAWRSWFDYSYTSTTRASQALSGLYQTMGPKLQFVRHLELSGIRAFKLLIRRPTETFDGLSSSVDLRIYLIHTWRTAVKLRKHLPSITCISVFDTAFDDKVQRTGLDWLKRTMPREGDFERLREAFPKLREIRLEGNLAGQRYLGVNEYRWVAHPSGLSVKRLEFSESMWYPAPYWL